MHCLRNTRPVDPGAATPPDLSLIGHHLRAALGVLAVLSTLAGCGSADNAASPAADPADIATAVSGAAEASTATHPLCAIATFADVQGVIGGSISKLDVIDVVSLHKLSCIYLDSQDLYNSLNLEFVTNERLAKTGGNWSDAAAYYGEWARGGTPVAGLGDAATWSTMPAGLYVLRGTHLLHLSGGKSDFADPAVRLKFEALARQVVARLP